MALGRSNAPESAPAPAPAAAPAAPVTAPAAAPLFSFADNVTIPGRGNGENLMENDPEYTALKAKLSAQHTAHKDGSLSKDKGTAFPSNDIRKHVRYLRAAANALNIGVAIKTPDGDVNAGRISFRAKDRKVYTAKPTENGSK